MEYQVKKGELFEAEVAKRLRDCGEGVYRRPKVMFHSQDMFGGDLLWLFEGEVVVIQCKKGNEMNVVSIRGRSAVRKNIASSHYVKRYIAVCCGRDKRSYLIQYARESEREALRFGLLMKESGVECVYELVQ